MKCKVILVCFFLFSAAQEVLGQTTSCKPNIELSILLPFESKDSVVDMTKCYLSGIRCESDDFIVVSFEAVFTNADPDGEAEQIHNEGMLFSTQVRYLLRTAQKGSTLDIICIKAKNKKSGSIIILKPRTFTL